MSALAPEKNTNWIELLEEVEELYPLALKALGMTHERIADRLGISSRCVEYWVAESKTPKRISWRMAAIVARDELKTGRLPKNPEQFQFYLSKFF